MVTSRHTDCVATHIRVQIKDCYLGRPRLKKRDFFNLSWAPPHFQVRKFADFQSSHEFLEFPSAAEGCVAAGQQVVSPAAAFYTHTPHQVHVGMDAHLHLFQMCIFLDGYIFTLHRLMLSHLKDITRLSLFHPSSWKTRSAPIATSFAGTTFLTTDPRAPDASTNFHNGSP